MSEKSRSRFEMHQLHVVCFAALATAAAACPLSAMAWQSGEWDATPFDQSSAMAAATLGRVAGAIARAQAASAGQASVAGGKPTSSVTLGGAGCQVNIGGISFGSSGVINNSNITLNSTSNNSTDIVVCK